MARLLDVDRSGYDHQIAGSLCHDYFAVATDCFATHHALFA